MTETVTATLLLFCLWACTCAERATENSLAWWFVASATSGLLALVQPAMIFVGPVTIAWAIWKKPARRLKLLLWLSIIWGIPVGGWIFRNARLYGFVGLSSVDGLAMYSHFHEHPEWMLNSRIQEIGSQYIRTRVAGQMIARDLMHLDGLTFVQASRLLRQQTLLAIKEHPAHYAVSVLDSALQFWKPTEELIIGTGSGIRAHWPILWPGMITLYFAWGLTGLFSSAVDFNLPVKLAVGFAVASCMLTSLVSNAETIRYAFPLQAPLLLAGDAVGSQALNWVAQQRRRRSGTTGSD